LFLFPGFGQAQLAQMAAGNGKDRRCLGGCRGFVDVAGQQIPASANGLRTGGGTLPIENALGERR
jgi:hypothetical protein